MKLFGENGQLQIARFPINIGVRRSEGFSVQPFRHLLMRDEAKAAVQHGTKYAPQDPVVDALVTGMAVEDHPAMFIEALVDVRDDIVRRCPPSAVPFE
jgi:hypothetical protein